MIISILTDGGSGGTFLNWSLHFLAGHTEYFYADTKSWHPVTYTPLTHNNSHNFKSNQINQIFNPTLNDLQEQITILKNTESNNFHSLYFHEVYDDESFDYESARLIDSLGSKNIVVEGYQYPLYYVKYSPRSNVIRKSASERLTNPDEIYEYVVTKYFNDSASKWKELGLSNIWDKREFIALNFKPFEAKRRLSKPENFYYIDCLELWTSFDLGVFRLFDYLELSIDNDRFEHWKSVYAEWRSFHYERILFQLYFNKIIDCILSDTYMDLTRFNLDIQQEATIQHELLYKHNLNLKTWQLTKFTNTRQLHSLLEPNIYHNLNS